jgi:hypothetical protein
MSGDAGCPAKLFYNAEETAEPETVTVTGKCLLTVEAGPISYATHAIFRQG